MTGRARWSNVAATLVALAFGLVFLAPTIWMVAASLKPDEAIHADVESLKSFVPAPATVENYSAAYRRGNLGVVLLNTVGVVVLVAVGGLLLNAPAAYAFARMRFPGREWLFTLVVATIIVPLEAIVIPLFLTVRTTHGLSAGIGVHAWTLAALSVPFMAKAFNIYLLRQAFLSLPKSLEEAAFLDGASRWATFVKVAVPNVRHALVTVVLLDVVIHWNDFLWPLVICQEESTRTIQLGLGNFFTQPPISWGAILAYATLATVPVMFVFALGQKWIVQSLVSTGVRE
jgi:ABC-type glycerol-3-phosphate transport system permease component